MVEIGWIETIPHEDLRYSQVAVVDALEGNDIGAMALWADHARVWHSRQKNVPRKVPSWACGGSDGFIRAHLWENSARRAQSAVNG